MDLLQRNPYKEAYLQNKGSNVETDWKKNWRWRSTGIATYAKTLGEAKQYTTELLVVVSQSGGAIAYLIFIGQNLWTLLSTTKITIPSFIFALLLQSIGLQTSRCEGILRYRHQ
ncbi:hypothetical protein QJS10_CPB18g00797 [Acorus calamus]|uniref:Uncharacterized protein n=1 Tax=Acorus calamus TaxID=4465 RepID=A0AAV9CNZ7_ACOCL|nr:hypothetical protein QJS10_CPB18g00797 [Acorus calamus]